MIFVGILWFFDIWKYKIDGAGFYRLEFLDFGCCEP